MHATRLSNSQYIRFVSMVAEQHRCKVIHVDLEGKIIQLCGTPQAVYDCTAELENIVGRDLHPGQ